MATPSERDAVPPLDGTQTPDLLRRAGHGDEPAVRTLLSRYLPGLRAFVRLHSGKLVRSKESCSDLVQSACREVLEHASDFAYGGEAGFKQWLYRTALRKIAHRAEYWRADRRDAAREHRDDRPSNDDSLEVLLAC